MAPARRKPAASGRKRSGARKSAKKDNSWNRQVWSVVLFAFGVLVLLFALIEGETAWRAVHNFLLGMFGAAVFLVPAVLIYAAIMIAMDMSGKAAEGRVIQSCILLLLVSAAIEILFVGRVEGAGEPLFTRLGYLYMEGQSLRGGGLLSFVLAMPLLWLFQKTGASIIICLLLFVFIMLVSSLSLLDLFDLFARPFRHAGNAMRDSHEAAARNRQAPSQARERQTSGGRGQRAAANGREGFQPPPGAAKNHQMTDIDIPLGLPESSSRKGRKRKNAQEDEFPLPAALDMNGAAAENVSVEEAEPLPVHPVASPKITKEKLEETAKTTKDNPDLDSIIKKAMEIAEEPPAPIQQPDEQTRLYEQEGEVSVYKYPPVELLKAPKPVVAAENMEEELKLNADLLVDTLKSFGVQTRIVDIHRGPTVTQYELQPSAGVKIAKITGLADDIALNLAAAGVRIEAPIPGKAAVGIEVPNKSVDIVTFREMIDTPDFVNAESRVSFALGRDIAGNVVIADIAKMPHMLIAGSTGSGKSVCINSIIMSLLYKASPDEVRILMIDPKVVELGIYNGIPHLLIPVVTDPKKAAGALNWAVSEMLKRYKLFADTNVRDLKGYNAAATEKEGVDPLPQIVVIIDELADLMMAAPNDVEDSICRLAQMARAAGMHLVIATQRPSVDVITGLIKANVPSRIAFAVSSQVDSRTILDGAGAEKLLGRGDMLFSPVGASKATRVQGCFVTDKEVEAVVSYIKDSFHADYDNQILEDIEKNAASVKVKGDSSGGGDSGSLDGGDELIHQAVECVMDAGQASTSYLQRRLKVGYARASRMMDEMEQMGIIGPFEGSKPRQILISKEQWAERKLRVAE